MGDCYVCGGPAGSLEHIIPGGIGGKLTSRGLLCARDNARLGHEIDAELCRQLNPLANVLGIAPKRNTPDVFVRLPQIEGGTSTAYRRAADGTLSLRSPRAEMTRQGDTATLRVEARSTREVRQVLEGYRRTYPQIDVDRFIRTATETAIPYVGPVEFRLEGLGGEAFFRGIAKIALGYALHIGVPRNSLSGVVAYVNGTEEAALASPCYAVDPLLERRPGAHVVAVCSVPHLRTVVGYVELFGVVRCSVQLSSDHSGGPVASAYGQDLVSGEEFTPKVRLWRAPSTGSGWPEESVHAALADFLRFAAQKSREGAVHHAVVEAFERLGDLGDNLYIEDLLPHLAETLEPVFRAYTAHRTQPFTARRRLRVRQPRRDLCRCGSGREYRLCCGKS